MASLNVSVKDKMGMQGRVTVNASSSNATVSNAKKIADWLKDHTDAQVVSYGASADYLGDECDDGKYDRVQQRLVLLFEDKNGQHRFGIPAPKDEDLDVDQQPISDLPEDVKDLLSGVGACDKGSFVYNGGGLLSKMPDARARKRKVTGE